MIRGKTLITSLLASQAVSRILGTTFTRTLKRSIAYLCLTSIIQLLLQHPLLVFLNSVAERTGGAQLKIPERKDVSTSSRRSGKNTPIYFLEHLAVLEDTDDRNPALTLAQPLQSLHGPAHPAFFCANSGSPIHSRFTAANSDPGRFSSYPK